MVPSGLWLNLIYIVSRRVRLDLRVRGAEKTVKNGGAMIDTKYVQSMARYNRWQNQSLYQAANSLSDNARRADQGAFFSSIHKTLSHLLWGDTIWMSRFDNWQAPEVGIPGSADWVSDWSLLEESRIAADERIVAWSDKVAGAELEGNLGWFSGALGRDVEKPKAICVMHFFNHQTHHRGQVHAMLTRLGAKPADTDLFMMPEDDRI